MVCRNFREATDLFSIENTGLIWAPRLLSVLRVVVGLLFIEHGTSKLFGFPPMPGHEGLAIFSLIGLSAILEFAGGLLMTVGLFTRATVFLYFAAAGGGAWSIGSRR